MFTVFVIFFSFSYENCPYFFFISKYIFTWFRILDGKFFGFCFCVFLQINLERGGEREKEGEREQKRQGWGRERETLMWERNINELPPVYGPPWDGIHNLDMCPEWELNPWPSNKRATWPGLDLFWHNHFNVSNTLLQYKYCLHRVQRHSLFYTILGLPYYSLLCWASHSSLHLPAFSVLDAHHISFLTPSPSSISYLNFNGWIGFKYVVA